MGTKAGIDVALNIPPGLLGVWLEKTAFNQRPTLSLFKVKSSYESLR